MYYHIAVGYNLQWGKKRTSQFQGEGFFEKKLINKNDARKTSTPDTLPVVILRGVNIFLHLLWVCIGLVSWLHQF